MKVDRMIDRMPIKNSMERIVPENKKGYDPYVVHTLKFIYVC